MPWVVIADDNWTVFGPFSTKHEVALWAADQSPGKPIKMVKLVGPYEPDAMDDAVAAAEFKR